MQRKFTELWQKLESATWSSASLQLLEASMFIDLFVDGEGRGSTDNCAGWHLHYKGKRQLLSRLIRLHFFPITLEQAGVKIYLLSIQLRTTVLIIIFDRSDN